HHGLMYYGIAAEGTTASFRAGFSRRGSRCQFSRMRRFTATALRRGLTRKGARGRQVRPQLISQGDSAWNTEGDRRLVLRSESGGCPPLSKERQRIVRGVVCAGLEPLLLLGCHGLKVADYAGRGHHVGRKWP